NRTRISTAAWPRSTAGSSPRNAGPVSSAISVQFRASSCAVHAGAVAATTTKSQRPPKLLHRHPHGRAQATKRAVAEIDVATVRSRDVASNRQSQPSIAFVLVAGVVQAQERFEYVFAQVEWNARTVVVDG